MFPKDPIPPINVGKYRVSSNRKRKNHPIIKIVSGGRGELARCPNFFVRDCSSLVRSRRLEKERKRMLSRLLVGSNLFLKIVLYFILIVIPRQFMRTRDWNKILRLNHKRKRQDTFMLSVMSPGHFKNRSWYLLIGLLSKFEFKIQLV